MERANVFQAAINQISHQHLLTLINDNYELCHEFQIDRYSIEQFYKNINISGGGFSADGSKLLVVMAALTFAPDAFDVGVTKLPIRNHSASRTHHLIIYESNSTFWWLNNCVRVTHSSPRVRM